MPDEKQDVEQDNTAIIARGWDTPILVKIASLHIDSEKGIFELNGSPIRALRTLDIHLGLDEAITVLVDQFVLIDIPEKLDTEIPEPTVELLFGGDAPAKVVPVLENTDASEGDQSAKEGL